MIANVENARLHLPAADPAKPNERTVLHPETNAEQVLMNASGTALKDFLGPQIIISETKPEVEEGSVLWAQVTSTRLE